MRARRLAVLVVTALGILGRAEAQTNVATTIGQFLLIEPSARLAAMGNAGSAFSGEAMAAYYNPAALGSLSLWSVQFTHARWLADIAYNYAVAVVPVATSSSVMMSVTSLRSGDIPVRTVEIPLGTGENYSVSDFAIGVGFGTRITDRVTAGIQVTYMQETIWHSSVSALGVNLGTQYRLTDDGIVIGASLSNFGSRGSYEGRDLRIRHDLDPRTSGGNSALPAQLFTDTYGLPVLFRVGMALPVRIATGHELLALIDASHPNNNTESVSLGAEYVYSGLAALRVGYQNLFEQDSEVGLTAGAGVMIEASGADIRFDYAWTRYGRLGDVQRMTVGFAF